MQRLVPLFGQNPTELCLIFNETLDFIYHRRRHRLESWNLLFYNRYIYRYMQMQWLEKVHLYITVLTLLMEQLVVFVGMF